ncbi:MAG: trimeric intracellular cation channel family protein [Hyphomonadaceae bacterium]
MEITLFALGLIGTAVFAASGAIVANEERFDLIGAVFLSVVAGLGGGTIVDLVSGVEPVRWVANSLPLWIAIGAGIAAFLIARAAHLPEKTLNWVDAAGLALFTAEGMERLMALGVNPATSVFLAAIGASGGGILRDTLANRQPLVFSPETELYVTAAIAGGLGYLAAHALGAPGRAPMYAALLLTFLVRAAGILFKLRVIGGRGPSGKTNAN